MLSPQGNLCAPGQKGAPFIVVYHTIKRTAEQGRQGRVKENLKKQNFFEFTP